VRLHGGVLEHPAASHAWAAFGLPRPPSSGGWVLCGDGGWTCHVEQGHYGHRSRKGTWLFSVGCRLPSLVWGPARGCERLDEGFHSKAERARARAAGQRPRHRMAQKGNESTPPAFAELLLDMARSVPR
jgi:hypothetical protein